MAYGKLSFAVVTPRAIPLIYASLHFNIYAITGMAATFCTSDANISHINNTTTRLMAKGFVSYYIYPLYVTPKFYPLSMSVYKVDSSASTCSC